MIDTRKYIFTFALTAAIFATAFFASSFFSEKRVENVKADPGQYRHRYPFVRNTV
jgi:hypothetical protein